ncbi:hypothetical protein O988_05066 [Pseudogymnoascus sp. VKM F-3808]|nr:hypothetical protein V490_08781 [Pseudogymnoascus sp. VKM F-3557]KFX96985.1 hypothetical protein O988_05066 [Pseudogymnoascus sp. VKM F-3808]KFY48059.1 hypothetical protein V495_01656 [Pseudogymnoascus sp. VKM F-4514 (FW-929)]KFY57358.1 hypothetical protein V497_05606 [Pseudogymnoascus sp. VKM F-4516 (FW-969)]
MADQTSSTVDETPISPVREARGRQNSLEKHLQHRPEPQELKDRHILLDTNAAPALQSAAIDLERKLAAQNLKKDLEKRSQRETLVERNILPESNAAPALVAHQRELAKHMRKDSLQDKLSHRPTAEELIKGGVLHEDPTSVDDLYEERIEDEYAKREGGA